MFQFHLETWRVSVVMLAPKVTWNQRSAEGNQAIRPPPTKESPLQEKNWEMQPLCLALGPSLKKENHPELVFWQKEPLIVSSPDGYVPARFAVGEAREDPTAATTDWWAWKYPSSSSKYTLVLVSDPGWPLWQEWYIWALGQYCLIAEEVAAV